MQKVILYYLFVPVPDPESVMLWQRNLCQRRNLLGRIIISEHGINGTIGGDIEDVKAYVHEMNRSSRFKGIEYKWSNGATDVFPRLSVKVRKELVTLSPDESFDVFNAGTALRPQQWHKLLEENPDMPVLDARNNYESEIGKFRGAITPDIHAFREIKEHLNDLDKTKPIATYCTGDIRCEYLSAYMKHVGFEEVYHLDGGIVKYGNRYKNRGLWEGKCYVFDRRKHLAFGENAIDIATCTVCAESTSTQANCANDFCPYQIVICESCQVTSIPICSVCSEVEAPAETART